MSLFWMLLITIGILQVSVFMTTIYLHRFRTHEGLELHPVVANLMHLQLALFTGIVPREWVAVHRKHHHFSDREGDPHSPYLLGLWTVFFGNYFFYKRETRNLATLEKYTPLWRPDLIDRVPFTKWLFRICGVLIFVWLFGWVWGMVAWAFHGVAYILLNSGVNSLCHMFGYRNYDNLATNFTFWALLSGGEGLHNNHHRFPWSARFARIRGEIDPAWPLIRLLELCRLAHVKPEAVEEPA